MSDDIKQREFHIKILEQLKENAEKNPNWEAIPRIEGAFFWGNYLTPTQYYLRYKEACEDMGWLDD